MSYKITKYTLRQAKRLGVVVKPALNKTKKIDVFRKGHKVASVGAIGYNDYPTWIIKKGSTFAKERRRLYRIRHSADRTRKNTAGYYADKLLW